MIFRRRYLTIALTLLSAACGGADDGSSQDSPDASPDAAASSPDAGSVDTLPNLAGTWGLRETLGSVSALPVVGPTTSRSYSLRVVELSAEGEGYTASESLCDIDIDSGTSLASNAFSEGYISSRPTRDYEIAVSEPAGFTRKSLLIVEGATLENPSTDELPTTDTDPRLVDEDNDQNPGLTMQVEVFGLGSAELFLVQRSQIGFEGLVESSDKISGSLVFETFESAVVGSTNELIEPDQSPVADAASSAFVMVRLQDGDGCAELMSADESSLFGPR